MSLQLYIETPFLHAEVDFLIKAFHNGKNTGYIVKSFFANGRKANHLNYSVDYETEADLLSATGDHAIEVLMEHAKEDIRAGIYFS